MKDAFSPKTVPTARDLNIAYHLWRQDFGYLDADEFIIPFLELPNDSIPWLRVSRMALLKSCVDVAKQLQISPQAYVRLEQREAQGRITIEHLRQAAEALSCELIYAIRPKSRKTFSQTVWDELLKEILPHLGKRPHLPHMRGHVLAALAREAMENPQILKKLRLTRQRS